jgi:hypothetical protein
MTAIPLGSMIMLQDQFTGMEMVSGEHGLHALLVEMA